MKVTLDLRPSEVVDLCEVLYEAQQALQDSVQCLELARVRPEYQELVDKKHVLQTVTKVLNSITVGGVRADARRST